MNPNLMLTIYINCAFILDTIKVQEHVSYHSRRKKDQLELNCYAQEDNFTYGKTSFIISLFPDISESLCITVQMWPYRRA